MHGSGQTKTVPIRRTFHAAHEAIHPLTHGNVAFHEGVGFGVSLSYAEQLGQLVRFLLKLLSLMRLFSNFIIA